MDLKRFDPWQGVPPEPWVREATERWATMLIASARRQDRLFALSPLARAETEVLFHLTLEPEERAEPAAIAADLHVPRQTMTGILDKLEHAGYVTRGNHATDRRRKVVRITEKGLGLVRSIGRRVLRRNAAFVATLPREKVGEALSFVERLFRLSEEWFAAHPLEEFEE